MNDENKKLAALAASCAITALDTILHCWRNLDNPVIKQTDLDMGFGEMEDNFCWEDAKEILTGGRQNEQITLTLNIGDQNDPDCVLAGITTILLTIKEESPCVQIEIKPEGEDGKHEVNILSPALINGSGSRMHHPGGITRLFPSLVDETLKSEYVDALQGFAAACWSMLDYE